MLGERGYSFAPSAEREIVRDTKEHHAFPYVAEDFEADMTKQKHHLTWKTIMNYKMDKQIQLKMERFRCPEVLFKPSLIGKESQGIHKLAYDSIIQRDLYTNIVLSGGTTMFPAIDARLTTKITTSIRVKIVTPPERKYSIWICGLFLSSYGLAFCSILV